MQGASSSRRRTDAERQTTPADQGTPIMSPQAEVVTAQAAEDLAPVVDVFVLERSHLRPPRSRWRCSCCLCWSTPCSSCPAALDSLFAVWAVLSLAAVAALLVRQQRGRRGLAATARRVELAFPELESHLINLVQFAGRDGLETDPFRQAAITQSAAAVADFPFDQAATRENRWRRLLLCMQTPRHLFESFVLLTLVLGLAVLCSAVVPAWVPRTPPDLASAHVRPLTGLGQDRQDHARRYRGPDRVELAEIAAEIDNPAARTPSPPRSSSAKPTSRNPPRRCSPTKRAASTSPRFQVLAPLPYRLQIGDTQTQLYMVAVYERPTVAQVEAAYEFPAYLERPRETVKQNQGNLEDAAVHAGRAENSPSAPMPGATL